MPPDSDPAGQRALISAELDRLLATGVRQVTPLHYVSGVFGGCAMFQRMFNEVNRKFTGRNVAVESGESQRVRFRLDEQDWGIGGMLTRSIASGEARAAVDPDWTMHPTWGATRLGHVNSMGLTGAGEILFDEMAQRGMIFDIEHASFRSSERLLELAGARGYPVVSSHSDFVDLGFTGPGDYSHGALADNDAANLALFDTTILEPLRHEGMRTRAAVEAIGALGGMCAPMLLRSRRTAWPEHRGLVPNDCEGSSKTWAQMYQYAVEMTGGHGVALSTDSLICAPAPRFGPSAAYALGLEHDAMSDRDERRFEQVDEQHDGVAYDSPIREWRAFRFAPAAPTSAWQSTPVPGGWENRPWEHADAWKAIAAWAAGRNPRNGSDDGIEASGDPLHAGRIVNFAWGLQSETEADVLSGCDVAHPCLDMTIPERFAGYCVRRDVHPSALASTDAAGNPWSANEHVHAHYRWMKTAWDQWSRMAGNNQPLRRHVFGNRDFDINLDGVAHFGMVPDFLQDVANSHPRREEVGAYLDPLFRSAEDYIVMWERCRSMRPAARRAMDP